MASSDAAFQALLSGLGKEFKVVAGVGAQMAKDKEGEVLLALERLVTKKVLVGIPEDAAGRKDGDEMNNAARLYVHEFGAREANISARPTLMPGIEDAKEKINRYFAQAARAAVSGDSQRIDIALHSAGTAARDAVKDRINSNTPPPLAPRTLQARRARGNQRTNTLVDTGEMRNAVTYVVVAK